MIPQIPDLDGYILTPDGKELRTPLQQIEKNKDDIESLKERIKETDEFVSNLSTDLDDRVRIPNIDVLPEDATPKVLIIDGQHRTSVKEYSNQSLPNSIAMRTGAGGLLIFTQYGNSDLVATLTALQNAQTCNSVDYFSINNTSYPYKPFQFSAKGWGATQGYAAGTITGVPTDANTEWYQKIVNASDNNKTVTIENGLQFNASYNTVAKCVSRFTDQIDTMTSTNGTIAGRENLIITVKPHSSINIRCRNRPTGYSQIWIT